MTTETSLVHSPRLTGRAPGLDVLRAVFALWVLVAHVVGWTFYVSGPDSVASVVRVFFFEVLAPTKMTWELHPAVLGFIVLSGYCIHRNGLRENPSDLGPFAIRRAFRILPIYFLATAAGLASIAISSKINSVAGPALHGGIPLTLECIVTKTFLITTISPAHYNCTWLGNGPLSTVTTEIALYIVYAAVFASLFWRGSRGQVTVITACVSCFLVALMVAARAPFSFQFYQWWQEVSVLGFLPYWWLGALGAQPQVSGFAKRMLPGLLGAYIVLTVGILAFGTWKAASPEAINGGAFILSELRKLAFAAAVLGVIACAENWNIKDKNPAAFIGRASYSIYALHAPIAVILCVALCPWWLNVALCIGAGLLLYMFVEKPGIRLGAHLIRMRRRSYGLDYRS